MPGYMTYLLKGEEGTRLREESFTAARATLLQKTEEHETNTLRLTDVQRVERRLDAEYRGPTLDLTPEQLQEIWRRSGAAGPMPQGLAHPVISPGAPDTERLDTEKRVRSNDLLPVRCDQTPTGN